MIIYNMRYRGPLEYDKFALNILQFHNEVNEMIRREMGSADMNNLVDVQKQITDTYNTAVGKVDLDDPLKTIVGFSENLYLNMLDMKEC